MRHGIALAALMAALGGCSGSGSEGAATNDVASGVRLMRERPLGNGSPIERMTRLAECSATLVTAADGPPPNARADSLRRTAAHFLDVAGQLAGRNGKTAADVARIRDETSAANRQLAQSQPQEYARLIGPATDACEMGAIMSDQELTG